jgi:hypothetical protein
LIFDIYILREDLWKVWALMVIGEGIKDEVDDLEILDEILEDSIKEDLMPIRNFVTSWTAIQDPRFPSRRILKDIDACLPGFRATCEYFTFQTFFCLMTSNENTAFDPCRSDEVYQDMTQPLSHYFIHSSDHLNVISQATCAEDYLASYRNDLRNGCRAIELHCWDGPTTPMVTSYIKPHLEDHEKLSSPSSSSSVVSIEIPLEEVLDVIKKSAFVTSPYPLILFIENHCSLPKQEMIAYYVMAAFGDKLVPANEIAYGSDTFGRHLPSPEDLFEKVILVISDNRHRYTTTTACGVYDEEIFKQKSIRPVSPVVISSQRLSVERDRKDVENEEKEGMEEKEDLEEVKEEENGPGEEDKEAQDEDKEEEKEDGARKDNKMAENKVSEDKENNAEEEGNEMEDKGEEDQEGGEKGVASQDGEVEGKEEEKGDAKTHDSAPNDNRNSSSVSTSASERKQIMSIASNQTAESFYHPNLREITTLISRNVFDLQSLHRLDLHNLLSFSEVDMLSYLSHKEALSLLQINSHHLRLGPLPLPFLLLALLHSLSPSSV